MDEQARRARTVPDPIDFDRDAAQRILRRAVDLSDAAQAYRSLEGISEQALVEAAEELGVDVAVVRRAALEERLGLLLEGRRVGDRLVGPGSLDVSRVVDGTPDEVLDRVDVWLRRLGSLRRQRREANSAAYGRRSDVAAAVQRSVRSITGSEDVRRIRRLTVVATPVDEHRTMVVLVADLELERKMAVVSGSGVAGVGSTVATIEALVWTPWWWLGIPASLAAGAGVLAARSHGLYDVETSMEGVLDKVVAGEVPASVLGGVTDRVLRNVGRSRRIT